MIDIIPLAGNNNNIHFRINPLVNILFQNLQLHIHGCHPPELALIKKRHGIGSHNNITHPLIKIRIGPDGVPGQFCLIPPLPVTGGIVRYIGNIQSLNSTSHTIGIGCKQFIVIGRITFKGNGAAINNPVMPQIGFNLGKQLVVRNIRILLNNSCRRTGNLS